jgi:hypothetical protein
MNLKACHKETRIGQCAWGNSRDINEIRLEEKEGRGREEGNGQGSQGTEKVTLNETSDSPSG